MVRPKKERCSPLISVSDQNRCAEEAHFAVHREVSAGDVEA